LGWTDAGQGWKGIDCELALTGWEDRRRVLGCADPCKAKC
jgi:hypothetical protein